MFWCWLKLSVYHSETMSHLCVSVCVCVHDRKAESGAVSACVFDSEWIQVLHFSPLMTHIRTLVERPNVYMYAYMYVFFKHPFSWDWLLVQLSCELICLHTGVGKIIRWLWDRLQVVSIKKTPKVQFLKEFLRNGNNQRCTPSFLRWVSRDSAFRGGRSVGSCLVAMVLIIHRKCHVLWGGKRAWY